LPEFHSTDLDSAGGPPRPVPACPPSADAAIARYPRPHSEPTRPSAGQAKRALPFQRHVPVEHAPHGGSSRPMRGMGRAPLPWAPPLSEPLRTRALEALGVTNSCETRLHRARLARNSPSHTAVHQAMVAELRKSPPSHAFPPAARRARSGGIHLGERPALAPRVPGSFPAAVVHPRYVIFPAHENHPRVVTKSRRLRAGAVGQPDVPATPPALPSPPATPQALPKAPSERPTTYTVRLGGVG